MLLLVYHLHSWMTRLLPHVQQFVLDEEDYFSVASSWHLQMPKTCLNPPLWWLAFASHFGNDWNIPLICVALSQARAAILSIFAPSFHAPSHHCHTPSHPVFRGVVFKISEVQLNQDSSDGFQELDPLPIEGGRGSEEGKCTICPQITLAYRYAIFLCSVENLVRKLKSIIQCLTTHCDTASLPEEVWLSSWKVRHGQSNWTAVHRNTENCYVLPCTLLNLRIL